MSTLLPIDATKLPRSLAIDPPMTDAELEEFCRLNDVARIERTKEGLIHMNAPAGFHTSDGNAEIVTQLRAWWKTHRRGRVCDSSAGFYLPDSSLLSPDASYFTPEALQGLSQSEAEGFLHVCPDFVIKLFSRTDRLAAAQDKMELWIKNGAQLGWLIDPYRRRVFIYKPGTHRLTGAIQSIRGEGPIAGFTLDLAEVWACYKL